MTPTADVAQWSVPAPPTLFSPATRRGLSELVRAGLVREYAGLRRPCYAAVDDPGAVAGGAAHPWPTDPRTLDERLPLAWRHWQCGRRRTGLVLARPLFERASIPARWFGHEVLETIAGAMAANAEELPSTDLWPLGGYCSRRERHDLALKFFEEAERRQGVAHRLPGWAGIRFGWSLLRSGQLERAANWARRLKHVRHKSAAFPVELARLTATVQLEGGDMTSAYRTISAVMGGALDRMSRTNLVLLLLLVGHAFRRRGELGNAEHVYDDVALLLGRMSFPKGRYLLWEARTACAVARGDRRMAREALLRAVRHCRRLGRRDHRVDLMVLQAQVASLQGHTVRAARTYLRASAERRARGQKLKELHCTLNAAALLLRSGNWHEMTALHVVLDATDPAAFDGATAKIWWAHRLEWSWLCADPQQFRAAFDQWSERGERGYHAHRAAYRVLYDPTTAPWTIGTYEQAASRALELKDPAQLRGAVMRLISGIVAGRRTEAADLSGLDHHWFPGTNTHVELVALQDLCRKLFTGKTEEDSEAVFRLLALVNPVSAMHLAALLAPIVPAEQREAIRHIATCRLLSLPPTFRPRIEVRDDIQSALRLLAQHDKATLARHAAMSPALYRAEARLAKMRMPSPRMGRRFRPGHRGQG